MCVSPLAAAALDPALSQRGPDGKDPFRLDRSPARHQFIQGYSPITIVKIANYTQ
jgi:hypothetical protein